MLLGAGLGTVFLTSLCIAAGVGYVIDKWLGIGWAISSGTVALVVAFIAQAQMFAMLESAAIKQYLEVGDTRLLK